tara:strand:+ start:4802 stop:6787 length:1986 start_codon:yes stop_codon:yes gene_type:complete
MMIGNIEPEKKIIEELINIYKKNDYILLLKMIHKLRKVFPNSIFLLNLLGNTQTELKNYNEAIQSFKKIIEINPNFAEAYFNLGIIYKKINNNNLSIINYNTCLNINPKKFEAYNNLGNLYKDQYNIELAIKSYLNCLEINPSYKIALKNFGVCLQNCKFSKPTKLIDKHIISLLEHNRIIRPVDIIHTIIDYLYLNPNFKILVKNFENINENSFQESIIQKFSNIKILLLLLENTPITDLKIEKMLRSLRSTILINSYLIKNRQIALKTIKSIAKQCFINEYLYPSNEYEMKKLKEIEKTVIQKISNNNLEEIDLEIACLAAYKSLSSYNFTDKINKIYSLTDLINQQIDEPKEEIVNSKDIVSYKINNKISLNVKNQYESNPYPRWNKIALYNIKKTPEVFFDKIEIKIDKKEISKWKNIDVLVAGCGTGQHAITTSTKYRNSFITAIDLSKKSLSYAKRKADELKIENIEFIQMDLLDLKKLGKNYNIIESVGVLHHMDNPFDGLSNLYKFLKPNGLMMIGLYSKFARQHITKIRKDISEKNIEINEKNLINFREKIISSITDDYNLIKQSSDFYSLSTLRDLLFHTQEHTFTITKIINYLNELNLNFCGFENKEVINLFKNKYKKSNKLYDLDIWNKFESSNPRIFAGMYQFWCQKI